jgi:hypothetical protein
MRAVYNQQHPDCPTVKVGARLAGRSSKYMHPGVTATLPMVISVVAGYGGIV